MQYVGEQYSFVLSLPHFVCFLLRAAKYPPEYLGGYNIDIIQNVKSLYIKQNMGCFLYSACNISSTILTSNHNNLLN